MLASAASARRGPQKNWPRQAIVAAATTTWAILMIRLTVTQFILTCVCPPPIVTCAAEPAAMAPAIRGAHAH